MVTLKTAFSEYSENCLTLEGIQLWCFWRKSSLMLQHMCEMGVTSVLPLNPSVKKVTENNSNWLGA